MRVPSPRTSTNKFAKSFSSAPTEHGRRREGLGFGRRLRASRKALNLPPGAAPNLLLRRKQMPHQRAAAEAAFGGDQVIVGQSFCSWRLIANPVRRLTSSATPE